MLFWVPRYAVWKSNSLRYEVAETHDDLDKLRKRHGDWPVYPVPR